MKSAMKSGVKVREPVVDGIFYPSEKQSLAAEIRRLHEAVGSPPGRALAVVSPHAAYSYSGPYAMAAFNAAAARTVKFVVIMAPVHRETSDEVYLSESRYFSTPLGNIPVSTDLTAELMDCSTRFVRNDIPHLEEHAIEVQLPFVQWLFPQAQIVPVLLARATETNARILSRALHIVFADRLDDVLFVVSSNLSSRTDTRAANAAMETLVHHVERNNPGDLLTAYHRKDITACGSGCIAAILWLGVPGLHAELVDSTELTAGVEDGRSIHYGAIGFYR